MKKLIIAANAVSLLLIMWIFVSIIDVNLHNNLDCYGNAQGGTQWKYNAFSIICEYNQSE